jgi:peptidoglycan/xylan/chitin deacetylase (PgdA/CDA1 family)
MNKTSKKTKLSKILVKIGALKMFESLPKPASLLVLNYHRIGDSLNTPFDPGVYSSTSQQFYEQIKYLVHNYNILTLEEALDFIEGKKSNFTSKGSILITFDDGYIDNYEIAYPILKDLGVQATFFISSGYIDTNSVPWWDSIAYAVKNTAKTVLNLDYPHIHTINLALGVKLSLHKIFNVYKDPKTTDPDRYLELVHKECGIYTSDASYNNLFIDWQTIQEMHRGGMAFGSHTHSHCLLSKMSLKQQTDELRLSKEIIQKK